MNENVTECHSANQTAEVVTNVTVQQVELQTMEVEFSGRPRGVCLLLVHKIQLITKIQTNRQNESATVTTIKQNQNINSNIQLRRHYGSSAGDISFG